MAHCTNVWKGEASLQEHVNPRVLLHSHKEKLSVAMESPRQIGQSSFTLWLHQLEHVASRIFSRAEEKGATGSGQCAE